MPLIESSNELTPYWATRDDETAQLYLGDSLKMMSQLGESSVDLAFADPPFNIGYEYDQYSDSMTTDDYLAWCEEWLRGIKRLLKPHASLWVASGLKYQAELKVLMDKVGYHWRDTVCWHYTFGPRQEFKFTPSWVALHYATVDPSSWTWNLDTVRVPSSRQLKYHDARAVSKGKLPDNTWILLPSEYRESCFLEGDNAILESRVCGTFKERTSHPCQMPTAVLKRIISACSNLGDLIFDPFLGSGTTVVSALELGRRGSGVELSETYLKQVVSRISRLPTLSDLIPRVDDDKPGVVIGRRSRKAK